MKPNFFHLATNELSQSAFWAWLLQWGDPQKKDYDAALCACAQDFIRLLIGQEFPGQPPVINKAIARCQYQNVDVWAEINDEFLIIIEDKTHTGEQGNQLERYRQLAEEQWVKQKQKPGNKLVCIWLKTGAASRQSEDYIRKNGFLPVEREALRCLFNNAHVKNDIFSDFTDKLNAQHQAEQSYTELPISKWDWNSWIGF